MSSLYHLTLGDRVDGSSPSGFSDTVVDGLKSARIQLAALRLQHKIENMNQDSQCHERIEAHHQLDKELEAVINLETNPVIWCEVKPKNNDVNLLEKFEKSFIIQIESLLQHLGVTFENIFEAISVLSARFPPLNTLPELDRVLQHSRGFEARFIRIQFEAKQQAKNKFAVID